MHVIHTVPAISEESSGPSYSVVRLCESLIPEGENVTLAALERMPMDAAPSFLKTFPPGFGPRRLGCSPAMLHWLRQQAGAGNVQVIHNHSLWMMPNVYPGRVARQYGIPYIVAPRGTMSAWAKASGSKLKRFFWPLVQRPSLAAVTCWHATAKSEYEDIRRLGFRQPVMIIPNGIDIPELVLKQESRQRTLLFLGRVHQKKGLDLLLPAWQAVQDRFPDWRLRIVGPDNKGYLLRMQRLARKLGLKRIEFSGALYGARKLRAYQEADLFILPTYSENFGLSVAEALAGGTPAIVTMGAPWAGLKVHGAGWWIDIGLDPLVTCLEAALGHTTDTLKEMGLRGRNWMEAEYAWEHIGRKMAETYRWMIHGGNTPAWVIME